MFNNIKTLLAQYLVSTRTWPWEPIFKHPFAVSGEGNLALVGKSKHSTASKSQLCFAQVTHPRGVFINLCQNLGNFGWVPVEIKSWKSCGGALSRLRPYVGCQCVWEGVLQTHGKPVMWRRRVNLGFGPQPADQRPYPIISSIMQAVLSPLLSHFWMSLFHFLLCQIRSFLSLSWEPSTQKSQGHPFNDVFTLAVHCKHSGPPVCCIRGQGQAVQQKACLKMMDGKEQAWRCARVSGTKQLHWAAIITWSP